MKTSINMALIAALLAAFALPVLIAKMLEIGRATPSVASVSAQNS